VATSALVSTFGSAVALATTSVVMAAVGLIGTSQLMPRAKRAGNFARGFPKRRLNLVFATVAVTLYSLQLVVAIALLGDSRSPNLTRTLVFLLVTLFAGALGRALEVAGIGHRSARPLRYWCCVSTVPSRTRVGSLFCGSSYG
jgi:hypothetical protein